LDELFRETIGMDSIIETLRRKPVKPLFLVMVKGIEWEMLLGCPGLKLCKERGEISPLDAWLSGNLPRWEDGKPGDVWPKAVI
jgi:hypothetical protein